MEKNKNKALSLIEKMKAKTEDQNLYNYKPTEAKMDVSACPNCGAGRAKDDGLTRCGYCGFKFLSVKLTDGINIKKENNSR